MGCPEPSMLPRGRRQRALRRVHRCRLRRSLPCKEYGNRLLHLRRAPGDALQVALEIELLVHPEIRRRRRSAAWSRRRRPAQATASFAADPVDLGGQFRIVVDAPDHAPGQRLLGADAIAEKHRWRRANAAHEPRQEQRIAGVRHQRDADEGLVEIGRTRRPSRRRPPARRRRPHPAHGPLTCEMMGSRDCRMRRTSGLKCFSST